MANGLLLNAKRGFHENNYCSYPLVYSFGYLLATRAHNVFPSSLVMVNLASVPDCGAHDLAIV